MQNPACSSVNKKQPATIQGLGWNMLALIFISGMHILLWLSNPEVSFWQAMLYMVGGYVGCSISLIQIARQLSNPKERPEPDLPRG